MVLLIELSLAADLRGKTTGSVNPGLLWAGQAAERGDHPMEPRSGQAVGVGAAPFLRR
jgi:hypothetical protein